MRQTQPKPIKCKVCRATFVRSKPLQKVCSPICALEYARNERARKERREAVIARGKLKTRSQWMREAQAAFNAYIRARDRGKPCICCGQPLESGSVGGSYDCGHYRSVGSAPHLRFDERNAHGQRKQCNRWGAGRAVDYRIGLIAKIGRQEVEALEAEQTTRRYTVAELRDIRDRYRTMTKAITNKGKA